MDRKLLEQCYQLLQRLNSRTLPGRLIRAPLRLLPNRTVVSICRGPTKGMKWICGSSNHGCWLGTYELEKQTALQRFVKPGMTVYDIGAHAGFYTLFFSRLVGARGMVYAFEPFIENVRFLLAHIQMNGLTNVKVIQAAVTEHHGLFGFSMDRPRSENRLIGIRDAALIVPGLSLDELAQSGVLSLPDLIKIDVEGAEARVLSGMRRLLEMCRPVVFVALDDEEYRRPCGEMLARARYLLYSLRGCPLTLSRIKEVAEIYGLPIERAATLREVDE